METRLKRFLSLALAIVMVIGMMPTNIVYATETEGTQEGASQEATNTEPSTPEETSSETCAHENTETTTVAATCTTDGAVVVTCVACNAEISRETIPAGHAYAEEVTTAATCTAAGVKTFTCTVEGCGATKTEEIEAPGHDFVEGVCSVCGEAETPDEEPTDAPAETPTETPVDDGVAVVAEVENPVAKIGEQGYETFDAALTAAAAMSGEVTIEIYGKVEYTSASPNLGASVHFVGKTEDAEICLARNGSNGYVSGNGSSVVSYTDLILSKPEGSTAYDVGMANCFFTTFYVSSVTYTNCTFPQGAAAFRGEATYTGCEFGRSPAANYSVLAYSNVDVTIDRCVFNNTRGIKLFSEGLMKDGKLTVKNTNFSQLTEKPAIVLTSGKSVTLQENTYSDAKGVFELDLDGVPNGTTVTSDVPPTCINDNGVCGVLVDGKIYTTVAQAAAVATEGSTVTLLHESTEIVELAAGVTLEKNGFEAANVTVAAPSEPTVVEVATLAELQAALADTSNNLPIVVTETITIPADENVELNLNGKTVDVAWENENEGKHIYAITNNGTLTITGNGVINTRGIFNYGDMTLTSGTINAIDGNGGYGVRNYASATFTMDGGTIATTLEDDHKVDKGGYDASPVRVDEGATFVMNGGTINNICDFTVNIDNYGTTTIKGGKLTSVHTTVANSGTMTISGGEFTCDGLEGITAHALWAAAGTTTITGGTFNGKDNYNGFNVDASEGAVVNIKGGNFLSVHSGSLYGEGTITVSGGTFFDEISADRCVNGYEVKKNADGTYGIVSKNVTAESQEEAQAALDNAVPGTTINLVAGVNYGTLVFRQNADSKVVDITAAGGDATGNEHYSKYENITIIGAAGATVDQIDFQAGLIAGSGANFVEIKNLKIQNVTFSGAKSAIWLDDVYLGINGLTIENCTMVDADGKDRFVYQQINGYKQLNDKSTNEYVMTTGVKNLTITGCTVENAYQVIESRAMENLTITNNTFKGIKARDMLITSDTTNYPEFTYTGTITITGNTSIGGEERFVRASLNHSNAVVVISNNTITNHKGKDTDYIKVTDGNNVTIENNKYERAVAYVAEVNGTKYETLAEAAAAAQAGDEIKLLADVAEDVTVPAGVIFNGNGKQVGVITAAGEITFKGVTKATNFGVQYTNTTINIGEGACLEITGTGRLVVGHGCTFNITGNITDAKTADKANIQPSLIVAAGASFTGTGLTFNVNNAYIKFNNNSTSKNSNANGTFNINVTNSIWEQTGVLAFYVPTGTMDPTFNFNVKDSVLNTGSHLIFGTKGETVIDNSNVNVGKSNQIENRGTMTIKNGSVVNGAVATSSNAINPGTLIVENATYAVTGQFSGAAEGTGTLIIKKGADVSVGSIVDKANVVIDATGMTADDEINFTANLSKFAGTVSVENNDMLEAKIVDGKIVLAERQLEGEGTAENPYLINNADDLYLFANKVNAGNTFDNEFVKLTADIDLNVTRAATTWEPIGNASNKFQGTFDGDGHTISNLVVAVERNNAGLFGFASVIKNLTINNATVSGYIGVGALVGELESSVGTVDNCHVTGLIQITGENSVGGLAGKGYVNIKDSSVIGTGDSFVLGVNNGHEEGDNIGGLIGHLGEGNTLGVNNVTVKNITVRGTRKVGGVLGTTARGNDIVGCIVENVTVESTATAEYANKNADTTTIGGVIGNYFSKATSGGVLKDCSVTNVTLVLGNAKSAGALVGGDRYNNGGAPIGVDTVSGNSASNVTGVTNSYLFVAEVDSQQYSDLQSAIDAAQTGNTVTLVDNITLAEGVTVPADKTVVLNLNGKTITGTPAEAKAFAVITNNGDLTITGEGAIVCDHQLAGSTAYAVNTITNCGKLTIESGVIENKSTADKQIGYAIDNNSTSADAIVIVNGGEVKASGSNYYDGIRLFANSDTKQNSVTVNGGEISTIWMQNPSGENAKNVVGSVTITDGSVGKLYLEPSSKFEAAITGGYVGSISKHETDASRDLTGFITGGSFSLDGTADAYLAEGCELVFSSGKLVVKTKAAAIVGDNSYTDLQEAVNAAAANGLTVSLQRNVTMTKALNIPEGATITLNMKGYTLNGSILAPNANLTIKNGSIVNKNSAVSALEINAGTLNLDEVKISSARHALRIDGAVTATINSGEYKVVAIGKDTLYALNVSGAANVTINGGTFVGPNYEGTLADSGAAVKVKADAAVTIKGGNFSGGKNNTLSAQGTLTVVGGTFDQDPKEFLSERYCAVYADGVYTVTEAVARIGETGYPTLKAAIDAAQADETVTMLQDVTMTANGSSGYGKAGIVLNAGITLDGDGHKLTVNGANATWDCAIAMRGGTVKNLTISGAMRGIFMPGAEGDVIIDNCIFENVIYTFNSDQGNKNYGVYISNSKLNGWTSFSDAHEEVVFTQCAFGEGNGYKYCRPYNNTVFDACTFVEGYEVEGSIAEISVKNMTAESAAAIISNAAAMIASDDQVDFYPTLTDAIAAAEAGDTIELLADVTATEVILLDKSLTIDGNDHKVTSSATRVFRVTNSNTEVTLNDVNMVSTAVRVGTNDIRGISVDPSLQNVKLTLNNCSVDFTDASTNDWTYAVNVSGNGTGHSVTINGGTYEGANVINAHGTSNTIVVKNAILNSMYPDHDEYYGACIWVLQNQNSSVEATGNTFNGNNAVAFNLGNGTALTESNNTDNTARIVAKIGDTYYRDLHEALTACKAGETVTLLADVDLAGAEWTPVGTAANPFQGIFDGNGKTISNLVVNGAGKSDQGFFGMTTNGEIKNLTIENAKVSGRLNVGVVAGTPYTSKYTNIKVTGHVEVNGMSYVGGVGGKNAYANWTDIMVDVDSTSYVKATSTENGKSYRTYVGGVIGFNGEGGHTFKNISSNIKVIGDVCDIGGLFGMAHYGNKFENVTFTGSVKAPEGAFQVGGIAGVWHNEKDTQVTFSNVTSTGSVTVGSETTTGSIVGGAYTAGNQTTANSGSLMINGEEAWLCVAQVGEEKYLTLQDAIDAVAEGGVITLIDKVLFTEETRTHNSGNYYDGLYYIGDKSFTIDLGGFTIGHDGSVNDYLLNFKNDGDKANEITLKNGKIDAGTAAYCAICTSTTSTQKITVNVENINIVGINVDGAVLKIRGGAELNVNDGTIITGKNSYVGIEAVGNATVVNINEGAKIYQQGTSSSWGCLIGVSNGATANVIGGSGTSAKGGFIAMTSGGTINVSGGEWIANTNGAYANDNNGVLIAQSANGAKSVVNVTGGVFKGGYNCYGDAVGDAQLNISGGNFNADPSAYVVEDHIAVEADGLYTVSKAAAKIGDQCYATLEEAFKAATSGCEIDILSDVTVDYYWDARNTGAKFNVPVTIDGNDHTIKFTNTVYDAGNHMAAFRFEADATVKNLTVDMSEAVSGFAGRFRAISTQGNLTVDNCTFIGNGSANNTRAIIFGETTKVDIAEQQIVITDSTFTGWRRGVSDNENGKDVKSVTVTGNTFTNAGVNISAYENVTFTGNTVTNGYVNIKSYTAGNTLNVTATDNTLTANDAEYNAIDAGGTVVAQEEFKLPVAKIGNKSFFSLQAAVDAAAEGAEIDVLVDLALSESVNVPNGKKITLDLNGKTITGTDNSTGSFGLINNKGDLTVKDSVGNGKITLEATNDRGWNAYSSVISNQPGGKLTVESSTIEHLGGTDMAYGIDNLTNGKGTYAEVVINGGTVKSPYRAIRQFLNGIEAKNILTVNGGTIEGTNKAIWMQDPSANANSGNLTVDADAVINGNIYLDVTEGSTKWPVEVSIAAIHGEPLTENVPDGYIVHELNGVWTVDYYVASITSGRQTYYYGTLEEAIADAQKGETIVLRADVERTETLVIPANKDIVLDLNGKTISMNDASGTTAQLLENKGTLTIQDSVGEGKLSFSTTTPDAAASPSYASNTITNFGSLTVMSGTIENTTFGGACYALDNRAGSTATINGGTLTAAKSTVRIYDWSDGAEKSVLNVNGGSILSGGYGINVNTGKTPAVELNITGGTISTTEPDYNLAVYVVNKGSAANMKINVTGGTFDGNFALNSNTSVSMTEGNVSVSGGTFENVICYGTPAFGFITGGVYGADVTKYCATGYDCVADGNGMYVIEEMPEYVAMLGDTPYETLQDAMYAVTAENNVVRLIANTTESFVIAYREMIIQVDDGVTFNGKIFPTNLVDENLVMTEQALEVKETSEGYLVQVKKETGVETIPAEEAYVVGDDNNFMSLQAALDAAEAAGGGIVRIKDDIAELTVDTIVVIPAGVTLDLRSQTLKVKSLIGVAGSKLTGAVDANKNGKLDAGAILKVAKQNLILDANNDGSILPIWDPTTDNGVYRFSQIIVNTDAKKDRGLEVNTTEQYLRFQFKNQATSDLYNVLMKHYGGTDLGFDVVARVEWTKVLVDGATVLEYHTFVYSDEMIIAAAGNNDYYFKLLGYDTLDVDLGSLTVYASVVSDTGAVISSASWNANGIK